MRYNRYRLINIVFRTFILYLLLGSLLGALILAMIIKIVSNLSIVKRILALSSPAVELGDLEKIYLDEIKEEIDGELTAKGIYKINYSLQVIDKAEMLIYSVGDNRIYLDYSFFNLDRSRLKACIYHEIGHIYYGDIAYLSSIILENIMFLLVVEVIIIGWGYYLLALLTIFIFYIYININLALFNRNKLEKEIRADRFVLFMGYGSDLSEVLLGYKNNHDKNMSDISSSPSKKYLGLRKRINEIEKNEV